MKIILKTTLGLSTAALLAATAQAGDAASEAAADTTAPTTQIVKTIDADNQVGQLSIVRMDKNNEAVLGAFEEQNTDAYIVQDNEGDLYINHLVAIEDLPNPDLDVETVETYEVTYRGMTFTNKVIDNQ